jgi:hypothetical protein
LGFPWSSIGWKREREYGELRCEKPSSITFVATDFLSVAKETHRRCPTSSTGSVRTGVFVSDFPHEIAMEDALHEINETLERKDIDDKHKAMILGENAKRFYNPSVRFSLSH